MTSPVQRVAFQFGPVLSGLVTALIFFSLCWSASVYAPGQKGGENDLSFLSIPLTSRAALAMDGIARMMWSLSETFLCLGFVLVGVKCWTTFSSIQNRLLKRTIAICAFLAISFAVTLWAFSLIKGFAFQGSLDEALENLWQRTRLHRIGRVVGLTNLITMAICALVALGFSALLEERPTQDLRDLCRRSRDLDLLLYLSATLLAFGVVEIATLEWWSLAPFPGTAAVKGLIDASEKLRTIDRSANPLGVNLASLYKQAQTIDLLKRSAQILVLIAGLGFTLLLASLYIPAALVLRHEAISVITKRSSREPDELLREYGFHLEASDRLRRVAPTLVPLIAGCASALASLYGQ
jgi:hypothetical protein